MGNAADGTKLMLSGIKVLDFTQYLAGPTVTRMMAEMGAEIIKIEIAPSGDPSRLLPTVKEGRSAYFVQQNRGKKSICLDLQEPRAREIVKELVAKVDVVVENFGPGVMKRKGFDYEDFKKINPRLIMASISTFGRKSVLSHKTGFDMIAQAFSGMMHMTGEPDGPPTFVGMALADVGAGVHAFGAIGYALFHRDRTGIGQYIDISMIDVLYHAHDFNVQSYTITNGQFVPKRMGRFHNQMCPAGVYKLPQGWTFILVLDRQWSNMARAMGRPELIDDPLFKTSGDRVKNRDKLNPIVQDWLLSFKDDAAALAALDEFRIPSAPVLSIADTVSHPYFKDRGTIRTVPDPVLGEVTIPGFPLKFSAYPDLPHIEAPLLGQHGDAILSNHLGYSAGEIEELWRSGILHRGDR